MTAVACIIALVILCRPVQAATTGVGMINPPQIGSQNVASADPQIAVPTVSPIVVPLFTNYRFDDFLGKPFTFTPPAQHGRWSKIVFVGHFACTAGHQFDRTCTVFVNNANVFFGTTAEPTARLAPSWIVERDVTDYASLLNAAGDGKVTLGNLVDSRYSGVLTGSAELDFYPVPRESSSVERPTKIVPLNVMNSPAALRTTIDSLKLTTALPRNVVRAYLDVIAQSQGNDEFWYTNVPDSLAKELQNNGGTAFRETEVYIDGRPAGVAPVFPWIYTGGINPSLWIPIPGVQTLNFKPYRVDLTPFAGLLSNGHPHTISCRVFNANDNFSTAAALLLYCDPKRLEVSGEVTIDTLTANPRPSVISSVHARAGQQPSGLIDVTSNRVFVIAGFVDTSSGRVMTKLQGQCSFDNYQSYVNHSDEQEQKIAQKTGTLSTTTTLVSKKWATVRTATIYRLDSDWSSTNGVNSNTIQAIGVQQTFAESTTDIDRAGRKTFKTVLDTVHPRVSMLVDSSGKALKQLSSSSQHYLRHSSNGAPCERYISAEGGVVKSFR
jgi:hypothetical protein